MTRQVVVLASFSPTRNPDDSAAMDAVGFSAEAFTWVPILHPAFSRSSSVEMELCLMNCSHLARRLAV